MGRVYTKYLTRKSTIGEVNCTYSLITFTTVNVYVLTVIIQDAPAANYVYRNPPPHHAPPSFQYLYLARYLYLYRSTNYFTKTKMLECCLQRAHLNELQHSASPAIPAKRNLSYRATLTGVDQRTYPCPYVNYPRSRTGRVDPPNSPHGLQILSLAFPNATDSQTGTRS
jgi:hypothetical protein